MINITLENKMLKLKKLLLLETYKKIIDKISRIFVKNNLIVFFLYLSLVYKTEFSIYGLLLVLSEVLVVYSLRVAYKLIELYPSVSEVNFKYKKRIPYLFSAFLLLFVIFIFFENSYPLYSVVTLFFISTYRIFTSQYVAFCYIGKVNKKFILFSEIVFTFIFIVAGFLEFVNFIELILFVLVIKNFMYFYNFKRNVYY